ncbi:hypothetical protein WMF04_36675 [Sorangium sp. So ce260]|uniref:hypothetical protein n=1 Tax=Sorangium sp. So ce260 TaxID=3133291 RepID=UPI003F5F4DB9
MNTFNRLLGVLSAAILVTSAAYDEASAQERVVMFEIKSNHVNARSHTIDLGWPGAFEFCFLTGINTQTTEAGNFRGCQVNYDRDKRQWTLYGLGPTPAYAVTCSAACIRVR